LENLQKIAKGIDEILDKVIEKIFLIKKINF